MRGRREQKAAQQDHIKFRHDSTSLSSSSYVMSYAPELCQKKAVPQHCLRPN
jgi:hypothetical protein